jgi:23S rRNA (pseudouridine1915-N3)-methyltransferase
MIKIIAIGKKHDDWVAEGIDRYQKRLKKPFDIEWVLLPYSSFDGDKARQDESVRLLSRISEKDYVILLDERGRNLSSPGLSNFLCDRLAHQPVTLVIGGAYGVNEALMKRANLTWSLSKLVFPHQLVRLIATEQLYRAQEIYHNRPYHHE